MVVQIRIPKEQLPCDMKRLVDQNLPLSHPARFVPLPIGGGWFSWAIFAGCCLVGSLLIPAAVSGATCAMLGDEYSPEDLWLSLCFLSVLIAWAIRQLFLIANGYQSRLELMQGRYREGLFFEREYVLILEKEKATVIPRNRLTGIVRRAAGNVESGAQAKGLYLEFLDQTGTPQSQWVPNSPWNDHIRDWHRTGMGI